MKLTKEEILIASLTAERYPPGHGLSFFSNKSICNYDDAAQWISIHYDKAMKCG